MNSTRKSQIEHLESRDLLAADWQNAVSPRDVNDSQGIISPVDALSVINELNNPVIGDPVTGLLPTLPGGFAPPPFVDVNGDGYVSPIDALFVINALNGQNDAPLISAELRNDTGADSSDLLTSMSTITGTIFDDVTAASQVTLEARVNDGNWSTINVDISGGFEWDPGQLQDGTVEISLRATDGHGHQSEQNLTFLFDTTGPEVDYLHLEEVFDSGVPGDRITDFQRVGFSVRSQDALSATLGGVETTFVSGSGRFSDVSLDFGENVFVAEVKDAAGNGTIVETTISRPQDTTSTLFLEESGFSNRIEFPIDPMSSGFDRLQFQLDVAVDESDQESSSIEDGFLIYVFNSDSTRTLIDSGDAGTPVFSLVNGLVEFNSTYVSFDESTVTLELRSVTEAGKIVVEFLNHDADAGGQAVIGQFEESQSHRLESPIAFDSQGLMSTPGPALNVSSFAESADLTPRFSNSRFDATANQFSVDVELKNTGLPSGRNVVVSFGGLPAGVTLANQSGTLPNGDPYVSFQQAIPSGGLAHEAISEPITLQFATSSADPMPLSPTVMVGAPNSAPSFAALSSVTLNPGDFFELFLDATDPDGDEVTFSLLESSVRNGEFLSDGYLKLQPLAEDIGTHEILIEASDGNAVVTQVLSVSVVADPQSTTRVSGVVKNTDELPLAGVAVAAGAISVLTDVDGNFEIDLGNSGEFPEAFLSFDPSNVPGNYPPIAEPISLVLGRDYTPGSKNVIGRPIFLPEIDVAGGTVVQPGQDTTVMQEIADGEMASVFVADGSLTKQDGTAFDGVLSITEVPRDLTPAALPDNLLPDIVVTIQPGEMVFGTPAPLTLPNRVGYLPGGILDLWSVDASVGEFAIVGQGRVTADGSAIETISGGIRSSSWHMFAPLLAAPTGVGSPGPNCGQCKEGNGFSSEVTFVDGNLIEEHALASYQSLGTPRGIRLEYNSITADPRPIFDYYFEELALDDLVIPLNRIGASVRLSNNDGFGYFSGWDYWETEIGAFGEAAIQADIAHLPTGIYDFELTTGIFNYDGGLSSGASPDSPGTSRGRRLPTGPLTGATSTTSGYISHVNQIESSIGAGWSIPGVQQIFEAPDGRVLIVDGFGTEVFEPTANGYESPITSPFSVLEKIAEGEFKLTETDQTVYLFGIHGIESITDRVGNQTQFQYNVDGTLAAIVDPVGLTTVLDYDGGLLTSVTDPAGRITQIEHDSDGNLVQITDPDNTARTFIYDEGHRMIGEIDKRGFQEETFYGFHGRVLKTIRKDGTIAEVSPRETKSLLPRELTRRDENPPSLRPITDNTAEFRDADGRVTRHALDGLGQTIQSVDNEGPLPSVARDENNLITRRVDGNGNISTYTYDDRGNLIQFEDAFTKPASLETAFPASVFDMEKELRGIIEAVDMNDDGLVDLVAPVTDATSSGFSIAYGNGNGSFDSPVFFDAIGPFNSMSVADFDGDGLLDVVSGAGSQSLLSTALGNYSSPRLIGLTALTTDPNPHLHLVHADLNNDGNEDLVGIGGRGDVATYLGIGNGAFQDGVEYSSGLSSLKVGSLDVLKVADVNQDGFTDILAINFNDSTVSVMLGDGTGALSAPLLAATPFVPATIDSTDMNADGHTDIVISSYNEGVGVLLGDGTGQFSNSSVSSLGQSAFRTAIGDFNGDAIPDVATANRDQIGGNCCSGNTVSILYGNGDGTLASEVTYPNSVQVGAASADFNNDGFDDLVTIGETGGLLSGTARRGVSVLFGSDDGLNTTPEVVKFNGNAGAVALGDLNGDRVEDYVVGDASDGVQVAISKIGGGAVEAVSYTFGAIVNDVALADINGDGKLDVVANSSNSPKIFAMLGNGDGTFGSPPESSWVGESGGSRALASVKLADFNGDSNADVVVLPDSSGIQREILVGISNADGTFSFQPRIPAVTSEYVASVDIGDLNGDGNQDLVFGESPFGGSGMGAVVMLGNGDGTFGTRQEFDYPIKDSGLRAHDRNGDGYDDVFAVLSNGIFYLEASATGALAAPVRIDSTGLIRDFFFADINGDGLDDLIASVADDITPLKTIPRDTLVVRLANENGDYDPAIPIVTEKVAVNADRIALGDVTGGGSVDIVFAAESGNVNILPNTLSPNSSGQPVVYTYDETFNQLTSMTDELGRITLYEIDPANGNRLSERRVVGELDTTSGETDDVVTTWTYTSLGLIASETDPEGRLTNYSYDASGRLTQVTFAVGTSDEASIGYTYDTAGNRLTSTDENGNVTTYEYDALDRLVRLIQADPDGSGPLTSPVTVMSLDENGNAIATTNANGNTSVMEYDEYNRNVSVTDPLGNRTQQEFSSVGNLIVTIDPLGNAVRNEYDSRNRAVRHENEIGSITTFTYDANDNMLSLTDPVGNTTSYVVDARNRRVQEINQKGDTTVRIFDAVGNQLEKRDAVGRRTIYSIDELNRVSSEKWIEKDGVVANEVQYSYSKVNDRIFLADKLSSTQRTFDNRSRLKEEVTSLVGFSSKVEFTYDPVGNITKVVDASVGLDATTNYEYDQLNRNIGISKQTANAVIRVEFGHTRLGQVASQSRFMSADTTNFHGKSDLYYDGAERISWMSHENSIGDKVTSFAYQYDGSSRIHSVDSNTGQVEYSYDRTGQLLRADHGSSSIGDVQFSFDANGNRTDHDIGDANEIRSDILYQYEYDREGNLIFRKNKATGVESFYRWDHRNRLTAYETRSTEGEIIDSFEYTYNVFDLRISKSTGSNRAYFVYAGLDVVAEVERDGSASSWHTTHHLHATSTDNLIASVSESGTAWALLDHLGTVRGVLRDDHSYTEYRYDDFGTLLNVEALESRYGFAGREFDGELGFYYNRLRYYSPQLGRFVSEDPIEFGSGETNLFRYAANNPVVARDPYGLFAGSTLPGEIIIGSGIQCLARRNGFNERIVGAAIGAASGLGTAAAICALSGPGYAHCTVTVAAAYVPFTTILGAFSPNVIPPRYCEPAAPANCPLGDFDSTQFTNLS